MFSNTALASGHNSENPAQALKHRTAVKSNKSFSFIKHYLTLVGQPQNFKNPISPSILKLISNFMTISRMRSRRSRCHQPRVTVTRPRRGVLCA